ncbi:pyridoxamine 5'-phosphate oxidase family protein [Geminisphaera colitermitum]|uniref:pyridoxamine 5'-phosphate oxidase family protein n=1 Tax=Geminisphaera colitermitum TaxID=1148786 RepID=UPI000158C6C1|nr:pyridoxamine 5'-phosphate oxidase family protein [Geminisphaera colitermitum]
MSIELKQTIHDYIALTRWAFLAIIRKDGSPTLRPIGSFTPVAIGSVDVYFSTPRDSEKVRSLRQNARVSFYFQHDALDIAAYKGVSLIGDALEIEPQTTEHPQAVAALSARSPHFKARVEKGELDVTAIFRVKALEVRFSDYARGRGPSAIQQLAL